MADKISWVRTIAKGKIDFIDLKKMDEGNSLELKVILVNTDNIEANYIFKIENCDNGPIISPKAEVVQSISPSRPSSKIFEIKANV